MKFFVVLCLLQISIVLGGERPKCSGPLDLVFVLDSSGSVGDNHVDFMLPFVKEVINSPDVPVSPNAVQIGVVVYSTGIDGTINIGSPSDADIMGLANGRGNTATGYGIKKAKELLSGGGRPDVKKVVLVITDGRANIDNPSIQDALNQAYVEFPDMEFIAVGVQPDPGHDPLDMAELQLIASGYQDENVFVCAGFADLINELEGIIFNLCDPEPPCADLTCPYEFEEPPPNKGQCLDVGCCWGVDQECFARLV